jgi:hypothetical protein
VPAPTTTLYRDASTQAHAIRYLSFVNLPAYQEKGSGEHRLSEQAHYHASACNGNKVGLKILVDLAINTAFLKLVCEVNVSLISPHVELSQRE